MPKNACFWENKMKNHCSQNPTGLNWNNFYPRTRKSFKKPDSCTKNAPASKEKLKHS